MLNLENKIKSKVKRPNIFTMSNRAVCVLKGDVDQNVKGTIWFIQVDIALLTFKLILFILEKGRRTNLNSRRDYRTFTRTSWYL
jgi:hypothetical protein